MDKYKVKLQGKQLQLIVEAVYDRLSGVTGFFLQNNDNSNTPLAPKELPGLEQIIIRDIHRTISEVENRIKIDLSVKRKTNYAKTPKEVYENKDYFFSTLPSFKDVSYVEYPRWSELTVEQQSNFLQPTDYKDGTLPWDALTASQKTTFSSNVFYVPNKVGSAEKQDGKKRAYIKLEKSNIVKFHSVMLRFPTLNNATNSIFNNNSSFYYRSFTKDDYITYEEEGAIQLIPGSSIFSILVATHNNNSHYGHNFGYSTNIGYSLPQIPQVLWLDYEYGIEELPDDLINAVAMLTGIKVFETVNTCFTQGLLSYSVQGFNASFGDGLYVKTMERFEAAAERILINYTSGVFAGGW